MRTALFALLLLLLPVSSAAQDYLYERDVTVPAYQTMREFFDMPNRPGHYEVILVSDAVGPLSFRIIRIHGEHERTIKKERSYHVGSHSFQQRFDNPHGEDDLMVEIANSNPAAGAILTVLVIEII